MAASDSSVEKFANLLKQDEKNTQAVKLICLSLHIIAKRHLSEDMKEWPQDKIIQELNKIRRVHLDRENLGKIDNLELLNEAVSNLYLQSNKITCIQNLECLPNLQVLVLSNNKIKKVEGIVHLTKLIFLDISENRIDTANAEELPKSIIILNLAGNPCVHEPTHRVTMIKALPKLKQLNGTDVSSREKIQAGIECEASDDEEDVEEKEADEGAASGCSKENIPSFDLQGMAYKRLPQIPSSIPDIATQMLLRSQQRLEESAGIHKRHVQEATNIRIKTKIRPDPRPLKPK